MEQNDHDYLVHILETYTICVQDEEVYNGPS